MSLELSLARARARRLDGRHTEALKLFQSAIDLEPTCAEAWYGRAQSLEELGQFQSAIEAVERARELDAQVYSAIGLFEIGNCHVELANRRLAIQFYDRALAEAPG